MWSLLSTDGFMPHGHCYLWESKLVFLHVISDSLIALAYFSIPLTLLHFLRKKKDVPFNWIFLAFGIFILACGTTHVMEIWTVWNASYWLAGWIKAFTAAASVATAVALIWIVPHALALRTPDELERVNRRLEQEINQRKLVEHEMRTLNAQLEMRVTERTSEFTQANKALKQEVATRLQMEAGLASERNLLRTLIDSLPDVIFTKDLQGRFVISNPATLELVGASTESELAGRTVFDLFPAELAELYHQDDMRVCTSGEPIFDREERSITREGDHRWYLTIKVPFRNQAGQLAGLIGVSRDITDRKQSEESLRESSERLRLAQQVARVGTFEWNIQTGVNRWTPEIEAMYGLPPGGFAGTQQTWENLVHPEDRAEAMRQVSVAMESGNFEGEWRVIWPDGTVHWLAGRAFVFKDESGKPLRLIGVNIDVTEHKRVEEELRSSQRKLAGVIGSAMDAIITVDGQQRVVLFNAAAEKMFACPAGQAVGQSLDRFIPERFRATHPQHIQNFGRTNVTKRSMGTLTAIFGLRANGKEFPIEASISQLESEGEKFYTVILRDVTERERAEQRFRQMIECAPNGMVMVDQLGKIVLVNSQIEKSFGYSRDELLGQRIEVLVPERFRAHHHDDRNAFLAQPAARPMGAGRDLFGLRKDRTEFPVEIGLNPLETEQGIMVLGTIVDITARKRAEEELRRSQAQLAGVIASAMDAIVTVDGEQRVVLFNMAAEKMFGCPAAEAIGQPLDRFIPERFRSSHHGHIQAFGHTNVTRRSMGALGPIFGLRANGKEFPIEASISQLESEGQKLYTVILRDITERQRAEERFRQVIERSPNGMVIVDSNGRITLVNAQIERSFGYGREELLGQPIETLVPERFRAHHASYRRKFVDLPAARPMGTGRDLFGLRKDGTEFPVEIGLNPLETEKGITVLGTIVDITERKRAEEALHRSQAQLAGVIGSAMDAIISVDGEHSIVLFNTAAEKMFRCPAHEAIGQPVDRFIPDRFRSTHREHIQAFGRTNISKRSMGPLSPIFGLRADGEEFPIEASISQLELHGEKLYTVILRDITERQSAENTIRQSEDRLAFALQMSGTGAWDLDLLDHTAYRSQLHDRIFGYETLLPTWTYEMFLDHVLPEDRSEVDTLFRRAITDKGDWSFECRIQRCDGEVRWISASGRHRLDKSGIARKMAGIVQDITERKQAAEDIRQLNAELEQRVIERTAQLEAANKELEAFSYSVSHDLRAPLRAIDGFSLALLEDCADKLDAEGKGYLEQVRGASQEMAQLIDALLHLARVTRSEMRHEVVNLSQLAQAIVGELRRREPGREVAIKIQEGLAAHGDKRLLRVLLNNLLGNAWKFTSKREHPEIIFGQQQKDRELVYFVRDNGAGFDTAYASKLFGAFQRLHSASEFEGTGIGLATVQRIVHRHGGLVWAEGAVNHGATFFFTFPDLKEVTHGEQSDLTGRRQPER